MCLCGDVCSYNWQSFFSKKKQECVLELVKTVSNHIYIFVTKVQIMWIYDKELRRVTKKIVSSIYDGDQFFMLLSL